MKRSEINAAIKAASNCFIHHHWVLPPQPRWDVTDFGLGDFEKSGLVLVNLAEEPEYCEKLMYAQKGQVTPNHSHRKKKEDIIVRAGELAVQVWFDLEKDSALVQEIQVNNQKSNVTNGEILFLKAGERITLTPGIWHEFYPVSNECILGEVSTANDDLNDNFFVNKQVGRFSQIEEDETPLVKLVSD
jgi:D-lyxose ketol-isomerase